jgi:glutaredoxin
MLFFIIKNKVGERMEKHKKKHEVSKKHKKKFKFTKLRLWQGVSIILFIALVTSFFLNTSRQVTSVTEGEEHAKKAVDFINGNLLQAGTKAILNEVTVENGMYKIKLGINGQEMDSYISSDGSQLFPQVISITDEVKAVTEEKEPDVVKNDKPVVEMFVMSHCPYGTQIEKGMIPVVNTLGDKIDFKLKFVNYAMHGQKEIDEQMNQYCIEKTYPDKLTEYLSCFLEAGNGEGCISSVGLDKSKIDACVAQADTEFGISKDYADKTKWKGNFPPFNLHNSENVKYGVRGSPSLVINGKMVSSNRDAASLLKAVCAGFNDKPKECETDMSSYGMPAPGFGFGTQGGTATTAGCGV